MNIFRGLFIIALTNVFLFCSAQSNFGEVVYVAPGAAGNGYARYLYNVSNGLMSPGDLIHVSWFPMKF